jgi:hypothetical protein
MLSAFVIMLPVINCLSSEKNDILRHTVFCDVLLNLPRIYALQSTVAVSFMLYNYEGHHLYKFAFRIPMKADIQMSSASLLSIVRKDIKENFFL